MERPLKQRLVGAAVLVVVVVLVLPELLSGRRDVAPLEPTRDDSGVPLRAHEFSLGDTPTAEEQAVAADELQPDPVPAVPAEAPPPDALTVAEPDPVPTAVPEVAPSGVPNAAPSGVPPLPAAPAMVRANAPAVAQPKPAVAQPKPAVAPPTPATVAPKPVAVQPQPAAPAKPAATKPETAPVKAPVTLSAWVVQIGSFGTRQKADELVAQLQAKGFRAFTLPYTSGGRTLHRVRVGPEQMRQKADEIAKRLEAAGYTPHVAPQE